MVTLSIGAHKSAKTTFLMTFPSLAFLNYFPKFSLEGVNSLMDASFYSEALAQSQARIVFNRARVKRSACTQETRGECRGKLPACVRGDGSTHFHSSSGEWPWARLQPLSQSASLQKANVPSVGQILWADQ